MISIAMEVRRLSMYETSLVEHIHVIQLQLHDMQVKHIVQTTISQI